LSGKIGDAVNDHLNIISKSSKNNFSGKIGAAVNKNEFQKAFKESVQKSLPQMMPEGVIDDVRFILRRASRNPCPKCICPRERLMM
jgi:hypothetical protein